jgi:RNA polymerase sigma-70 factor (sigma-E family)
MRGVAGQPDQLAVVSRADASVPFEEFVDASSARLFSMALLLTGQHRAEAEDLLQGVLERAYRRWHRICQNGDPEPYVRQMLANASVDRWRRLRRRPEEPLPADPGQLNSRTGPGLAGGTDQAAEIADRDLLLRALAELPVGQRAVLVLRYLADLSEAQTARALGCSVGSVKSQSARGIARLRRIAGPAAAGAGGRDE